MNLESIFQAAKDKIGEINANDVLKVVGLQLLRSTPALLSRLPIVALFGGGVALGAGAALLFAPASGAQTRAAISHWVKGAFKTAKVGASKAIHTVEDVASDATGAIEDGVSAVRKKVGGKAKLAAPEVEA